MSVARVIPKRIRDQQDANMSPGSGTNGYAIVYNHTSGKFELGTFDASGAAAAAVAAHVALSDPHTQYALESALGTAAVYNVGTGANNIVQLDGSAKLPAVDGSQLTNLPGGAVAGSTTQVIFNDAGAYGGDAGLTYAKATDQLTVAGGLIAGDWSPPIDSTTAVSIWNAARSSRIITVDTTNGRVGINKTNSESALHVAGTVSGSGYKFGNQVSTIVSSTNSYVYGWYQNATLIPANGLEATNFGFQGYVTATAGYTVSSVSQIDIGTLIKTGSGTLTNVSAIYIRNQNIGINNYGIYQAGTANLNYFGGKVGLGITSPSAYLDLAASTTTNASLRVRAGTAPTTPNAGDIWYATGGRLSLYRAATEIFATGVQATGGSATAGATWTSTEQTMLQKVYDAARAFGMLS